MNTKFSVGGGFVVNENTKGAFGQSLWHHPDIAHLVDENLFYKGVDKSSVHGARLHQHVHVVGSPSGMGREPPSDNEQPPYPFKSGDSLLNLTRAHNVWPIFPAPLSA
jgi:hypothetical protein